jgi:hypothetical protein
MQRFLSLSCVAVSLVGSGCGQAKSVHPDPAPNYGYGCNTEDKSAAFFLQLNPAGLYDLTFVKSDPYAKIDFQNLSCRFSNEDGKVFSCLRDDLGEHQFFGNRFHQIYMKEGQQVIEDKYSIQVHVGSARHQEQFESSRCTPFSQSVQ